MSPKLNTTSFGTSARRFCVLQVLLLLSLLLTMLVPSTSGQMVDSEMYAELRCTCLKTMSRIHPSSISKLEVIREGVHCSKMELIATMKDGKKICLNTEAPRIKKMLQKMLKHDGSVV
ncbi:platelet basic protein [Oryctolagus cuniculus]|uniref:platelet basic protein n=1 Tax=Oryctolagus cuniculus TaxID=9986 RepID=UPI00222F6057|nr:platelet basic protein [Oryctolagus cuniculus]